MTTIKTKTMIKTKIIATLGPASSSPETIKALINNGADLFRLNFSHGTLEQHQHTLDMLNSVRSQHLHTSAVIGDLCGPKIRTSNIEPEGRILQNDEEIVIVPDIENGAPERFGTNYKPFVDEVLVGHRVLIDDGNIALEVVDKQGNETTCKVIVGGPISSHKGINLPDSNVSAPAITERDWECVDWAIEHKLDFLALSFVRSADEVNELKEHLRKASSPIKLISKIEKPQAVDNLETIVRASDAVLVARGDLGVEMDLAEVPLIQKRITHLCRRLGKPVIVATQMLQSMITAPTPTRAEVSDVANAILDLTDAVMLSGETAVGKYPVQAAKAIQRIAAVTETFLDCENLPRPRTETGDELALTATMARSVGQIVDDIAARIVVVWSQTGSSARLLSKARIDVPIVALSSDEQACRQMGLHYGVISRCKPKPATIIEFVEMANNLILSRHWAQFGDQIVVVTGQTLGAAGTTNSITVHTLTGQGCHTIPKGMALTAKNGT